jgi:hypothetical protein
MPNGSTMFHDPCGTAWMLSVSHVLQGPQILSVAFANVMQYICIELESWSTAEIDANLFGINKNMFESAGSQRKTSVLHNCELSL